MRLVSENKGDMIFNELFEVCVRVFFYFFIGVLFLDLFYKGFLVLLLKEIGEFSMLDYAL